MFLNQIESLFISARADVPVHVQFCCYAHGIIQKNEKTKKVTITEVMLIFNFTHLADNKERLLACDSS